MTSFLEKIKSKINSQLTLEQILIVDNSNLHSTHKSFDKNKYHLKLIIKSEKLRKIGQINAHRAIFSILKDEMKNKIHSLEIKIK